MKLKYIFLLVMILFYIKYKINKKLDITSNIHNINPDIIVACAGRYGSYQLGICHYIKNNFDIKHKKILGFSAGSWNACFMSIKQKYDNDILKEMFKIKTNKIPIILKKIKTIVEKYNKNDYNIENIYIGLTNVNGLEICNKFLTIEDLTRCCTASSFIPFLTCNDLFYVYHNKLTIDGGIYYKKYVKSLTNKKLIIDFRMFGRYKHVNIIKETVKKYKPSMYQLYITGYQDAKKNHACLESFF